MLLIPSGDLRLKAQSNYRKVGREAICKLGTMVTMLDSGCDQVRKPPKIGRVPPIAFTADRSFHGKEKKGGETFFPLKYSSQT